MSDNRNKRADGYLRSQKKWVEEQTELREIILSTGLQEEIKWMHPCYVSGDRNIVILHAFKDYCAILFFKGVLMKDPKNLLIQQTAAVQAGRQLRFTSLAEVKKQKATIKAYIKEAIAIEESGAQVPLKKAADYVVPKHIEAHIKKVPGLLPAFNKLTPGRRKAYSMFFEAAKQEKTLIARIDKYADQIFAGKGMLD